MNFKAFYNDQIQEELKIKLMYYIQAHLPQIGLVQFKKFLVECNLNKTFFYILLH